MSKKFVEQEIAIIKTSATATIPSIINNGGDENAFTAAKKEMNIHVLQALLGGEVTKNKKGETKVKFSHKLPTTAQVANIAEILDSYYATVEVPYRENLAAMNVKPDNDMDMPVQFYAQTMPIPVLGEKIKNKGLQTYILNPVGAAICDIRGTDCIKIAAYGEQARKDANFKLALIIGGAVLVVAGGITAGVVICTKKKDDAETNTDEYEEIDIDDEDEDIPEVELEAAFSALDDVVEF